MSQAEWEAAATKSSGGRIPASKKEMEDWVGPAASVKASSGFARDSDLYTIRRYEHADMRFALGHWTGKTPGRGGWRGDGRCADG